MSNTKDQTGVIVHSNGDITIYKINMSKRVGDRREIPLVTMTQQEAAGLGLMLIRSTRATF